MLISILFQYIIFGISYIKSMMNMYEIINSIFNGDKVCDSLDSRIYQLSLSDNEIRSVYELTWNIITNHDIFKRMTQNDTSIYSFKNRKILIWNGYLKRLSLEKWDYNLIKSLTTFEKKFIGDLISNTLNIFNTLRICHKDTINNSDSIKEAIIDIISQNTCFILNGINKHLPSVIYKTCKGLIGHYKECYGEFEMNYIYNTIKENQKQLLIAECLTSNYDVSNITETRHLQTFQYSFGTTDYNWSNDISIPILLLVISCFCAFIGYICYNTSSIKRADDIRRNQNFI
ncbi:putative SP-containing membrane protein [Vairimorpha necatrix]|uniref:SP-containing membrane protein n=1 Tax=Vairimorpha necatrix TaxID=6039 RepID=A0AAX4JCL1_9MICR